MVSEETPIRAQDAARLTGLSRSKVYLLAQRGEIPHFRHGGSVRFDRREVLDWWQRHRQAADSESGHRKGHSKDRHYT